MSDWDSNDDAEASYWQAEDDYRHEMAITEHLVEQENNELDRLRRATREGGET